MGFAPSDEQALLRPTVGDFAEAELRFRSREWDEKQASPRELLPLGPVVR